MKVKQQSFQYRQEMNCETFEIFNYTESRKSEVPVHHHDFYEVYFCRSDNIHFMVEGKSFTLNSGDILFVSPDELHRGTVEPNAPDERVVLWIDRRFLAGLHEPGEELDRCFKSGVNLIRPTPMQRATIQTVTNELVSEYYGKGYCSHLASLGLFIRLMVELNRLAPAEARIQTDSGPSNTLIPGVLAYIGEHYAEDISLNSLAEKFFVSKYHLSHEFSATVGTSVYKYIILKRLAAARQLILGGMSPGDACHECGYRDYSNFYRAFVSLYGTNPDSIK